MKAIKKMKRMIKRMKVIWLCFNVVVWMERESVRE